MLISLDVDIDGHEMAMAIQNGLPGQYGNIATAHGGLADDSKCFFLKRVISRLLQEKTQSDMKPPNEVSTSCAAALLGPSSVQKPSGFSQLRCTSCRMTGRTEDRCRISIAH